ncbi:unnamed protein product [Caenorhabditis bovis]|uniref:Uncharacterized protein n=1 Tax=Caenorhabditis bovis TaxID=2654633 RepID=A0A8S1ECH0_9PELO|nr:unnamed protein product [Caenorhabditis bovis]
MIAAEPQSREQIEIHVRYLMAASGITSIIVNLYGIYLLIYYHGSMDSYRFHLLYFQMTCLIFDVYFSHFMVPIPLFPITGGYSIGILGRLFRLPTHYQMVAALWFLGNTITCIFVSLLKRHQAVAKIEQKNRMHQIMVKFSILSSNTAPVIGTFIYALSEPDNYMKRIILSNKFPNSLWVLDIPTVVIYDISFKTNPMFTCIVYSVFGGSALIMISYNILYFQLFVMLNSVKTKISQKNYKKHFTAVINTILQNLVFFIFYVIPAIILFLVIYFEFDATYTSIFMIFAFSVHSTANAIVVIATFPTFRRAFKISRFAR